MLVLLFYHCGVASYYCCTRCVGGVLVRISVCSLFLCEVYGCATRAVGVRSPTFASRKDNPQLRKPSPQTHEHHAGLTLSYVTGENSK
jgi:hypothetical protein